MTAQCAPWGLVGTTSRPTFVIAFLRGVVTAERTHIALPDIPVRPPD
jgi:hypothetical protein